MFPDEEEDEEEMTKPTFEYDPDIDDYEGKVTIVRSDNCCFHFLFVSSCL